MKLVSLLLMAAVAANSALAMPVESANERNERVLSWWLNNYENLTLGDLKIEIFGKVYPFNSAPGNGWTKINSPDAKKGFCQGRNIEFTVNDPLTAASRTVKMREFYPPRVRGSADLANRRGVILIPPTGGKNRGDDLIANRLCVNGIRVLILKSDLSEPLGERIKGKNKGEDVIVFSADELDPLFHDRSALRALVDVQYLIKYLNPKHANQVGIVGASVGGIMAGFNVAINPRLNTGAIIMAGVGLSHIVGRSNQDELRALREQRKQLFNLLTDDDYEAWLHEKITIEPGLFAARSLNKTLRIYTNKSDKTVPANTQDNLVMAFSHPGNDVKPVDPYSGKDHVASIVDVYLKEPLRLAKFFLKNLSEGNQPKLVEQ